MADTATTTTDGIKEVVMGGATSTTMADTMTDGITTVDGIAVDEMTITVGDWVKFSPAHVYNPRERWR